MADKVIDLGTVFSSALPGASVSLFAGSGTYTFTGVYKSDNQFQIGFTIPALERTNVKVTFSTSVLADYYDSGNYLPSPMYESLLAAAGSRTWFASSTYDGLNTIVSASLSPGSYVLTEIPRGIGQGFNRFKFTIVATGKFGSLFTTGSDTVDFNDLNSDQQIAIQSGAVVSKGLGGNDSVTLPSAANFDEPIGGGKALNWSTTTPFQTGSIAGEFYSINGSDGDYNIQLGAGSDTVTIIGNGSSVITGGSGAGSINITGNGANTVTIGSGTDDVTITGTGANTVTAGTSDAGISITNFSGSLTGSAPSPSPGATVILTGEDTGNATIGNDATLELAPISRLNGTISFATTHESNNATLKIDQPLEFTSQINNLRIGDKLNLKDVIKTEAIDGNKLILSDNLGNVFNYQISGDIYGNGFLISDDGIGGTNLTLKASPDLDSQSSELAGKIIDVVQSSRDAFLKATALALESGQATELLETSDTLANACAAIGVGVNFTVAGAALFSNLSKSTSALDRYKAVEAFDIDITNTLAKAVFVFMAAASPAVEVAFLSGLLGTAVAVGTGPLVVIALLGAGLFSSQY